ncbi:class I SAM-dependent methyltransferase [Paractinoplanes brasiliensis]|nr:methyltransferase domain-containing protein [Actinoplanes brasiliensis]
MAESRFDGWTAAHYARLWPELFEPSLVEATTDFLAGLAGGGAALEFGVGTGRIAIPLSRRRIPVYGIELSAAMIRELRAQPGSDAVTVSLGDFATTTVDGSFSLVYLLRNTITNLTTREEQAQAFRNAAGHLGAGGRFVIENYVPVPAESPRLFADTGQHRGVEVYDVGKQIAVSHHTWILDGEVHTYASAHRYVGTAELDDMARAAGMSLRERWADWQRGPFTDTSPAHISVWQARVDLSRPGTAEND